ncbi:chloride channel protein [Ancylomarina sp. 16SWW S1-10-2]|uniref:chloride channel protein n=1 Tax=Ancylomarina sp. 16SWW S1-10-2 TaxID=2499681 RepID=UPI0012AD4A06|nr:chloride channel protein [Ancylomarina sp. 16SWW S1-10-2]MRT91801.1 chloride channel protein [Ancylomarina sp. 16SWW S1-10-2]
MKNKSLLSQFLIWRMKHIKERQFVLILSFIVGLVSGLAALILKTTIHQTHHFLTQSIHVESVNLLYLGYPMVGILLTVLYVKFFVKDNIGHGVSRILYAISQKNSQIKSHNNYSSIIASTLTIGFGGSVGSEAPVVLTGASIGSNLGRMFHLNYKTITLMVGCGVAGAIGGIFKAPMAGMVFTLEVLMLDLTMASLIPLLISSITGASVVYFFMGKGVLLSYGIQDSFVLSTFPYYILLGVFTGFVSLYFTRAGMYLESQIERITNPYKKLILGGLALGILIFLFPPLYGEGYKTIQFLIDGNVDGLVNNSVFYFLKDNYWLLLIYVILILVFKVIATTITTGSGGVGGIFAPALFLGGISGFFVARFLNAFDFVKLSESNFTLIGMAGVMAGVMHAPLTAIFLIVEITGGYALFIPIMITATIAYLTIMYFEPHSIYTKRLAKRGELITHNKDKAVLTLMKLGKVIETDLKKIDPDATLGELVKTISHSHRNIFPVVDKEGTLLGIVLLDDIRHIMFNPDMYEETYVRELMTMPPAILEADALMDVVMKRFEETGAWNLPVTLNGKYYGFVSKSKIFNVYRRVLVHFSDE